MTDTTPDATIAPPVKASFSSGYMRYALALLMVIYTLNILDRQILTILAEPIKQDLGLADWQLGAITGLAFAVFYTGMGLPIARLADRGDRVWLISASLAIWSAFTMVCGLAKSFPHLLIARLGVGFGEAGCSPAAHSLISEMTPRPKLASALAFYSLGIPLGSLIGLTMGGLVADAFGWRVAFFIAGAPGLLVAVLAVMTLKEPRRLLRRDERTESTIPLAVAMRELRTKRSFWWISLGTAFGSLVFYSQSAFYGSLFMRAHGEEIAALGQSIGLGPAGFLGLALGLLLGLSSGLGTYMGGQIADRAAKIGIKGYTLVPMIVLLASSPFYMGLNLAPGAILALACVVPASFAFALAYGPIFASVQSLVSPGVRATASAVHLFVTTVIGLGLGPLIVGLLSDAFAVAHGPAAGLQYAMACSTLGLFIAGGCFYLAGRSIGQDEYKGA